MRLHRKYLTISNNNCKKPTKISLTESKRIMDEVIRYRQSLVNHFVVKNESRNPISISEDFMP